MTGLTQEWHFLQSCSGAGLVCRAYGTRPVARHPYPVEIHRRGIESEQAVGEQMADAGQKLQRLGSLDGAKHAGYGSKHTNLGCRRHNVGWWFAAEDAPVAGRSGCPSERMSLEAHYAAV